MESEAQNLVVEIAGYEAASNAGSIALMSQAISLKRIADEICGVPYDQTLGADNSKHRMGLVDGIMHAIEQGLLAASQRG
jgi:hypothetical protein